MSADNQIAILNLKDQSRVIHISAPDNLYWSYASGRCEREIVPTRVVEYFIDASPMSKDEAMKEAMEMDDNIGFVEYGIGIYNVDATWSDVIRRARRMLVDERDSAKALKASKSVVLKIINVLDDAIEAEYQKIIGG